MKNSIWRCLTTTGTPMLKIRRSRDRLILDMGIPIPGKDGLYIETGPDSLYSFYMTFHVNIGDFPHFHCFKHLLCLDQWVGRQVSGFCLVCFGHYRGCTNTDRYGVIKHNWHSSCFIGSSIFGGNSPYKRSLWTCWRISLRYVYFMPL